MLHEGIGATKLDQTEPTIFRKFSTLTSFFLDLFYMFHGRYWNCRPQNSALYNRKICQRVENTSFRERLSCILQAFAKDHQGYKSNFGFHVPFDRENPANLGSKIRFWIRRKEHTLREIALRKKLGFLGPLP